MCSATSTSVSSTRRKAHDIAYDITVQVVPEKRIFAVACRPITEVLGIDHDTEMEPVTLSLAGLHKNRNVAKLSLKLAQSEQK